MRYVNVDIDGVIYYPNFYGKLTALPETPARTGYIWDGYYTAETGGEQKEITAETVFTNDATLYDE